MSSVWFSFIEPVEWHSHGEGFLRELEPLLFGKCDITFIFYLYKYFQSCASFILFKTLV